MFIVGWVSVFIMYGGRYCGAPQIFLCEKTGGE
jgi:hypothetical protein